MHSYRDNGGEECSSDDLNRFPSELSVAGLFLWVSGVLRWTGDRYHQNEKRIILPVGNPVGDRRDRFLFFAYFCLFCALHVYKTGFCFVHFSLIDVDDVHKRGRNLVCHA